MSDGTAARGITTVALLLFLLALAAPADTRAQAVGFMPGVSSFPNGVTLPVTPVVSDDRRYVRLTLAPQFNALEGFDNYSVPAAVSGGGGVGGLGALRGLGGGGGGGGGGRFAAGMNGVIEPGAPSGLLAGFDGYGPIGPTFASPCPAALLSGYAGPIAPPRLSAYMDDDMPAPRIKASRVRRPVRAKHGKQVAAH